MSNRQNTISKIEHANAIRKQKIASDVLLYLYSHETFTVILRSTYKSTNRGDSKSTFINKSIFVYML